jgi:hypothetical protein
MIKRYLDFINEVKRSKLNHFTNPDISSKFTASIEIELETDDEEGIDEEYTEEYIKGILDKIKKSVSKELLRIDNLTLTEETEEFIDNILSEIEFEYDDYEYVIDKLLNSKKYKSRNNQKLIVEIIKQQVLTYFFADNFEYLEEQFKENIPNFYNRYKDLIKFELDNTLDRGIELSNIKYFEDINDLIEFIELFYSDYNNQQYWKFTDNTGIHINLGIKEKSEYNVIKGLLFLNDTGENPFVFKNMEWRQNSKFCGSLISKLSEDKELINKCNNLLSKNDIESIENSVNPKLLNILRDVGYKNFGVNLVPLSRFNYIEFRYPGGEIQQKDLIDKVLYFAYITYLITNKDFDKKEYYKKLYKFLEKNSIQNASKI